MDSKATSFALAKSDKLELENFIPYRLNDAAERVSRAFARIYGGRYGLTRPEWRCLATVGQFDRTTAKAICTHSSMHKTKVSRAVYALEQRKWLVREADQDDRRVEHLKLTDEGRRIYQDLADEARAYDRKLATALGAEDAAALRKALAAIERRVQK